METGEPERTPEGFFDGSPDGLRLYAAVEQAVRDIGDASIRVTKSQIAFSRRKGFLYLWRPGQYVKSDVPAVLSVVLPREVTSPGSSRSPTRPATYGCTTSNSTMSTRSMTRSAAGWSKPSATPAEHLASLGPPTPPNRAFRGVRRARRVTLVA